jgi:CRP-like cAMP-binding protein
LLASQVCAFDLFSGLTEAEARLMAERAIRHRVERGRFLLRQGDPARCLVLLTAGQVKLEYAAPDGTVAIVDVLGQGNALFFIESATCPVSAVALGTVEYATLLARDLERVLRAHPDIALSLLYDLARRLHRAYSGQRAAVRSGVRLADALARIAADSGARAGRAPVVALSHADLAEVAGMARETVTRHLSQWQSQGIVELGLRRVRVRDLAALRRLAQDA